MNHMERVFGWSEQGGTSVVISGTQGSGVQRFQESFRGATVTVFDSDTVNLASIFSDDLAVPTVKSNPFTSDATTGAWDFYAPNGLYDIQFSGGSISAPFTIPTVTLWGGIPSFAYASLPTPNTGNAGNLARVTDEFGGLWMSSGTQWVQKGPVINIQDAPFNCVPDGDIANAATGTDNLAGFQAAIDALADGGGRIIVPVYPGTENTYRIHGQLNLPDRTTAESIEIVGLGGQFQGDIVASGATLFFSQTDGTHGFSTTTNDVKKTVIMRSLTIIGLLANAGDGIHMEDAADSHSLFEGVSVMRFGGNGWRVARPSGTFNAVHWNGCQARGNSGNGFLLDVAGGDWRLMNCYARDNGLDSATKANVNTTFSTNSIAAVSIVGGDMSQYIDSPAIIMDRALAYRIENVYLESDSDLLQDFIQITGGSSTLCGPGSIKHCTFNHSGASGANIHLIGMTDCVIEGNRLSVSTARVPVDIDVSADLPQRITFLNNTIGGSSTSGPWNLSMAVIETPNNTDGWYETSPVETGTVAAFMNANVGATDAFLGVFSGADGLSGIYCSPYDKKTEAALWYDSLTANRYWELRLNSSTLFRFTEESFLMRSGDPFGIFHGNGTPEGSITANIGSLDLRRNGGVGVTGYIKQEGSGTNVGWDAIITGLSGTFTMTSTATLAVANTLIHSSTRVILIPTNAAAATLMAGASSLYISAVADDTSFTVATADAGSAAGTETFEYVLVN